MHGHVITHRDRLAAPVEHCARIITALFDIWRKGRAPQRRAHLFGHRSRCALENRQLNWIERNHFFISLFGAGALARHSHISIIKFENKSTLALHPGGTTVVALYSCTIAGPTKVFPGNSRLRSSAGVSIHSLPNITFFFFNTAWSDPDQPGDCLGKSIGSDAATIRTRTFTTSTRRFSSACP